jgi:PAS domain S-box-containing protein
MDSEREKTTEDSVERPPQPSGGASSLRRGGAREVSAAGGVDGEAGGGEAGDPPMPREAEARPRTPLIQEEALLPGERGTEHYLARVAAERRHTLRQLRRQMTLTRALSESLGEGIYALDIAGRATFVNPAAERMLGWSEAELLGKDMHETIHYQHADGSEFPKRECPLVAVLRTGQVARSEDDVFIRRDGTPLAISYVSAPVITDGQITGAVLAFHDISERKRNERCLRMEHAVSRVLADSNSIEEAAREILRAIGVALEWELGALWMVDAEADTLRNLATWHAPGSAALPFEAATAQTPMRRGEGLPGHVWQTGEPVRIEDLSGDQAFLRSVAARAVDLRAAFGFPLRGDRATLGVIELFTPLPRLPDDDLLRTAATLGNQIGQFIEKRQAEHAALASEARTRAIVEMAPDCIISMDASGLVTEFNPAAERTFGYTRAQAIGQPVAELIIPPDLRQRHLDALRRYLEVGEGPVIGKRIEVRGCRADGTEFPIELVITRIPVPGPPTFTAHLRDITERQRTEHERTRLLKRAQSARTTAEAASSQLRALQAIAEVGLAHLSLDELLREMLERVREVLRVDMAAILLVTPDGGYLTIRATSGLEAAPNVDLLIPMGMGVAGRIAETRQPVVIDDLRKVEVYNPILREITRSFIGVPLEMEGRVIGVIHGGARQKRRFTTAEVELLGLVAERVAIAVDRARLFEDERKARAAAERAQRRFEFLAEAGTVLASSLEYEHTLAQLAWLIVPELADACHVDVLDEDGTIRRLAYVDRDPEKMRLLTEMRSRHPLETAPEHPIIQVLRTGESLLTPAISEEQMTGATGGNAEAGEIMRRMDYRSAICVPLWARGWIVGALSLLVGESGRVYTLEDVALAEDLGRRAGLAVDNARLFNKTQRALHQVEEIADQLLMQATQLDAVIEAIPGVVFVCDAHGRITRLNPSASAMFGLEVDQAPWAVGADEIPASFFSPDGQPLAPEEYPLAQALRGVMSTDFRCMMKRFDTGEEIQLLMSFAPIRDGLGQITGAVAAGNDVSTIYRLEQQKDEFLSIASHELKTPLTSLKILAQLTRRRLARVGAREAEQLAGMERSIERMERLVNDLLDVSRIEGGKLALRLEEVDLRELCRQAAEEQTAATDRAIALELPAKPLRAVVDPERIGQVLTNLLSNALKYSPHGCQVSLSLGVTPEREALFTIHDEGAGIPPELQHHLFQRFYRVPGVQVQSGSGVGLGLGLYISREIVERHHGRIWVESDVGSGASFRFTIPLER